MTKPREEFGPELGDLKFQGFARDRTRTSRDFHKLHGTSLHGIRISIKSTGRDRDREHFHGISLDGNGIAKIPRGHGIIPYPVEGLSRIPWNPTGLFPTGLLQREKSGGKACYI